MWIRTAIKLPHNLGVCQKTVGNSARDFYGGGERKTQTSWIRTALKSPTTPCKWWKSLTSPWETITVRIGLKASFSNHLNTFSSPSPDSTNTFHISMFLFSGSKRIYCCLCEREIISHSVSVLRGLQHTEERRTDTLLATLLYRWCRAGKSGPMGSKPGAWLSTSPSEGAHEYRATWRSFPWRTALLTLPSLRLCQETPRTRARECWTKKIVLRHINKSF